jgi:dihydroorotate dehydrogenase
MGAVGAALARWGWRVLLRPFLFRLDAERAHHVTMSLFSLLMALPGCRWLTTALLGFEDPRLRVRRFGLEFPNPVGLSAGVDKDAAWCDSLLALGFGFVEVGTLTARAQPGNPKPRVFRLPADQALLNRMGSPNRGAAAAAARLARQPTKAILGVNIISTVSSTCIRSPATSPLISALRTRPGCATFRPGNLSRFSSGR